MAQTVEKGTVEILHNGAFTLPDTETDTDTDKFTLNPMEICVDVCFCAV